MNEIDFKLSSYDYTLSEHLIAKHPTDNRSDSKLLVYNCQNDQITHSSFKSLTDFLPENALLVRNNSKVFPCRLLGNKESGGKAELFILSLSPTHNLYPTLIKASGKRKLGERFILSNELMGTLEKMEDGTFWVKFNQTHEMVLDFINSSGHMPLPPYINRDDTQADIERYQTVYAKELGSVAAPTAGLHFNQEVFLSLKKKNIHFTDVTLHVGIGTFRPVETDDIRDHKMHTEYYNISKENLKIINHHKENLFAVGTTSLRVLESAMDQDGHFNTNDIKTNIFLYPGVNVRSIKGLITNFHLPKSSLIMLVSSLIGREKTLFLYNEAIKHHYRFYSYGDAMLILR